MRRRSPYTTRPSIPGCGAPGFLMLIFMLPMLSIWLRDLLPIWLTGLLPIWLTGPLPIWLTGPLLIWWVGLLPMLKLLPLILLRRLVQVLVFQILVIQVVAIQTLVTQMVAATHPNPQDHFLPYSKKPIHGQRMVTHNYTLLNNH